MNTLDLAENLARGYVAEYRSLHNQHDRDMFRHRLWMNANTTCSEADRACLMALAVIG